MGTVKGQVKGGSVPRPIAHPHEPVKQLAGDLCPIGEAAQQADRVRSLNCGQQLTGFPKRAHCFRLAVPIDLNPLGHSANISHQISVGFPLSTAVGRAPKPANSTFRIFPGNQAQMSGSHWPRPSRRVRRGWSMVRQAMVSRFTVHALADAAVSNFAVVL
jgi:hypothetical protein